MRILATTAGERSAASVKAPDPNYSVIYETARPCGVIPCWGADVCQTQSVAVRFEPRSGHYLKRIGLWFMSNAVPGDQPEVTVTLRNDRSSGAESMPGDQILERWTLKVTAHGWTPVREELESAKTPYLEAGVKYWLAAESEAVCGDDGVWNMAGEGAGFSAIGAGPGRPWTPGHEGAVPATIVWGIPPVK
ncbi:MAG TPA: hypothetical protein VLX28_27740 [Thermoanaerobaculia bacterium]|nr:hypothetical protein [Thermoanaerobaculia bacterium]